MGQLYGSVCHIQVQKNCLHNSTYSYSQVLYPSISRPYIVIYTHTQVINCIISLITGLISHVHVLVCVYCVAHCVGSSKVSGGGTGPADPAAAGPMFEWLPAKIMAQQQGNH